MKDLNFSTILQINTNRGLLQWKILKLLEITITDYYYRYTLTCINWYASHNDSSQVNCSPGKDLHRLRFLLLSLNLQEKEGRVLHFLNSYSLNRNLRLTSLFREEWQTNISPQVSTDQELLMLIFILFNETHYVFEMLRQRHYLIWRVLLYHWPELTLNNGQQEAPLYPVREFPHICSDPSFHVMSYSKTNLLNSLQDRREIWQHSWDLGKKVWWQGRTESCLQVGGWVRSVILSGRQTSVIIQFWALETGSVTPLSQVLTTRIEINTNPPELTQIRNQCRESTKKSIHFCLNFEISLVPVSCVSSQVTHTNHFSMSTSSFLARPTPCKVVPPLLNEVGGVCFSFCPVLQPLGRPRPLKEISH